MVVSVRHRPARIQGRHFFCFTVDEKTTKKSSGSTKYARHKPSAPMVSGEIKIPSVPPRKKRRMGASQLSSAFQFFDCRPSVKNQTMKSSRKSISRNVDGMFCIPKIESRIKKRKRYVGRSAQKILSATSRRQRQMRRKIKAIVVIIEKE